MSEPWQWQELMDMTGIKTDRIPEQALPEQLFPCKSRISLIGTTGAGKSALVAGLVDTAEEMVKRTKYTDNPFYFRLLEKYSNIRDDVSKLRDGWFPEKTAAYDEFISEAGLLFEWERHVTAGIPLTGKKVRKRLWHKMLQVPICDFAGEDLVHLMRKIRMQTSYGAVARRKLQRVMSVVRQSDGYIIILKASRAKGFGKQLEKEKDPRLSEDPDVNLVRMLEDIAGYKARDNSHPIRGIAVVVTAVDRIAPIGQRLGFDLLDENIGQLDMERFVASAFKSTYAAIQGFRIPNVKYFPSFFYTEKDENDNEILCEREVWNVAPDGTHTSSIIKKPKIMLKDLDTSEGEWWEKIRQAYYSQKQNKLLLDWLKELAVTA